MTVRDLRRLVSNVRVRPGWTVKVESAFRQPPEALLVLKGRVQDTGQRGRRIPVEFVDFVPDLPDLSPRAVLRQILRLLDRAERHETREWLRYLGTRPFDPHHEAKETR